MKPRYWKKTVLLVLAAAAVRPGLAVLADSSAGATADPEQISVLTLSEEQRNCLAHSSPQACFGQMKAPSPDGPLYTPPLNPSMPPGAQPSPGPGSFFTNVFVGEHDSLGEKLSDVRENYLKEMIQADPHFFSGVVNVDFGVMVGGQRFYDDQIYADPDMHYTEQNAKNPGVWMRHTMEIRPELNAANSLLLPSEGFTTEKSLGAGISYTSTIDLVKRHDLDKVYKKSFWGYTKQDVRALKDALPLYFRLPFRYRDMTTDYLPGEGIEIERYGNYSFYVGTNVLSAVHPASFAVGWFLRAGVSFSKDVGHYKTIVEMKRDGVIRLVLEKIGQQTAGLSAQAGPNMKIGPVNASVTAAEVGIDWSQTHIHVLDLLLDMKDPKCEAAILKAYSGDFGPAQKLALAADPSVPAAKDPSVVDVTTVKIDSSATHKFAQFLFWGKESRKTQTDEIARTLNAANATPTATESHYHDETVDVTAHGIGDHYHTLITLRTDLTASDPSTARTLDFEKDGKDSGVDPDDLQEIVRVGQTIVPAESADDFQKFRASLGAREGDAQFRLDINFDPTAFAGLLVSKSSEELHAEFWTAWATLLELSNADTWSALTENQRWFRVQTMDRDLPKGVGQFARRYGRAATFLSDVDRALRAGNVGDQARGLVNAIHGLGDELYPIGALVTMSDHQHLLGSFRLTLNKDHKTRATSFLYVGAQYLPASENLSYIYR